MKTLPAGLVSYRRTPQFDQSNVPKGLLGRHDTKAGTWALIQVLSGEIVDRILEPLTEDHRLVPGSPGVVEPGVAHQLVLDGPVRFYVEFFRSDGD